MDEYRIYCCHSHSELDIDTVHYFGDQAYCDDCLDEVTSVCYECGARLYNIDIVGGDDERPLCESCYDSTYTNCDCCGRLIHQENSYYDDDTGRTLCNRCVKEGPIYNYSYKPSPIFHGESHELSIGVELELDDGGCSSKNARILTELANEKGKHIYIKTDGSLDEGFEIVSHPMTLKYHKEIMPWKELTKEALSMGYRSHKAGTCGLHCHVNRTYFGNTCEEQEWNIGKVLFLVEKYWEELLRFSRRTQGQMDHWAARYGFKERPDQVMNCAKNSGMGRYTCVNLENYNTIEFRMWRGTLKYNTLIATLQMVERLCKVAIFSSEKELQDMSWWSFICHVSEPELITYLKERQLYINEPVATEEEE